MPLKPGDRIERYVIDAPLGHGGMGDVYRAHDERLQRSVALKVLHAEGSGDVSTSRPASDGTARMLREARAAAALEHPNVVAIYDVGQVAEPEELRGTMYLAMELIRGLPLRAYVGDEKVTPKDRLRWLASIARALAAAHAAGLVHRDVKPENVMIREDGQVKVLDFGLAKRATTGPVDATSSTEGYVLSTTARGVIMGTPRYMAPEQLRGEPLDGRADQFAWGVVAYELLSGKLPWSMEGGAITLVSQILSAAPPPFALDAAIPPTVTDVIARALSKTREARFATMEALLEALEGPVSALAETAAFAPTLRGATAPPPPGSGAIASAPVASKSGEGASNTASGGAVPQGRGPAWRSAGGTVVAALVVAVLAVGAREEVKKRALSTAAAKAKDAAPVGCTSNRACAAEHGGEPYVCRASDHLCVAIASQDCKPMYEPQDLESDDTVWLGALFPTKGPEAAQWGDMNADGVDFARTDIAQAIDSLEESSLSRNLRRVALVVCDDSEDAKRSALHLVDDVGVPAILGFRSGSEVIGLASSLLTARGVVAVASISTNPLITRLPQPPNEPRLVWRTTYNFESIAEATASFVRGTLEPRQRGGHKTRLVLIRDEMASSSAFADALYRQLVFNGKTALENGHDYQEVVINSKSEEASIQQAINQIVQMDPTIVVSVKRSALPAIVEGVEARLPQGAIRPIYISANSDNSKLAPFMRADAERRHRVFAVQSVSDSTPNARFVIRYNQARRAHVTRVTNPSVSYDAFFLLAYASYAIPAGEPVTGLALADRVSRLVGPGRQIEVGPGGVLDALPILTNGGTIDLEGVASGLDFDLSTGEAPSAFALLCPAIDEQGRTNGDDVESGVVYQAKDHRLEGSLTCP